MSSSQNFTPIIGPLGWAFPLLNSIRQMFFSRKRLLSGYSMGPRETMKNAEKWAIVRDEKGRMVALEIHRTVEEAQ